MSCCSEDLLTFLFSLCIIGKSFKSTQETVEFPLNKDCVLDMKYELKATEPLDSSCVQLLSECVCVCILN